MTWADRQASPQELRSSPGVRVRRPQRWSLAGLVPEPACGMVECQCGPAGVHRLGAAAREMAVQVAGDLDGGCVADRPEGTDDVPAACGQTF